MDNGLGLCQGSAVVKDPCNRIPHNEQANGTRFKEQGSMYCKGRQTSIATWEHNWHLGVIHTSNDRHIRNLLERFEGLVQRLALRQAQA
jgi:hypothetical protein